MTETSQKRRGRPKKSQEIADETAVICEPEAKEEQVEISQQVKQDSNLYYTAHKYKIGDVVWVPVNSVKNIGSLFGAIKAKQMYTPQKVTISCVLFTNHIMYKFKQSTKLILSENYVFDSQTECQYCCDRLMTKG